MTGPTVNFEHEHMEALGLNAPPAAGTKVALSGKGHVLASGSHVGEGGKPRHHMTVQLNEAKLKKVGVGARLYDKAEVDAGNGE